MVPVSAADRHEFTPASAGGRDPPPVFVLRTPTLRQRAAWRRDVAAAGARFVAASELLELLRQAVAELAPANADELIELIDQVEAMHDGRAPTDADAMRQLHGLEQAMATFQPYAELVAARAYWWEISTLLAFRHFVADWRDVGPAYVARNGLIPEELVSQVPDAWVYEVGGAAIGLTTPDAEQRKNSASPRPSPSDPAISAATTAAPDGAGG